MNIRVVVVLFSIIALVSSQSSMSEEENLTKVETTISILDTMMERVKPKELFKVWHFLFKPDYFLSSEEAVTKYKAFKSNLKYIKETNSKKLSYTLGLNQFSDLTIEEYRATLNKKLMTQEDYEGLSTLSVNDNTNFLTEKKTLLDLYDDEEDNRRRNLQSYLKNVNHTPFLKPIRNQGQCGSCWAFATTATVEGNFNKANPTAQLSDSLSTQQLVDCDSSNGGCNGGSAFDAFKYVDLNGLAYDRFYSYKAIRSSCQNVAKSPIKTNGIKFCSNYYTSKKCSRQLINDLLQVGPLSVGIDAGTRDIQNYRAGIFTASCSEDNHAVVLVGFVNDTATSKGYLLVRNSWGTTWGEKGYIKVGLNEANNRSCFVENEGILPIIIR